MWRLIFGQSKRYLCGDDATGGCPRARSFARFCDNSTLWQPDSINADASAHKFSELAGARLCMAVARGSRSGSRDCELTSAGRCLAHRYGRSQRATAATDVPSETNGTARRSFARHKRRTTSMKLPIAHCRAVPRRDGGAARIGEDADRTLVLHARRRVTTDARWLGGACASLAEYRSGYNAYAAAPGVRRPAANGGWGHCVSGSNSELHERISELGRVLTSARARLTRGDDHRPEITERLAGRARPVLRASVSVSLVSLSCTAAAAVAARLKFVHRPEGCRWTGRRVFVAFRRRHCGFNIRDIL